MAILINLEKIQSSQGVYYYLVQTNDFKLSSTVYVGIDGKEKRMYLYKDAIKSMPDCSIDLFKPENIGASIKSCDLLPDRLVTYIMVKVLQVLNNEDYPAHIAYAA